MPIFCIQLIETSGGSWTVRASTPDAVRARVARETARQPLRWAGATLPFPLVDTHADVGIPYDWLPALGALADLYKRTES